jgi:hypothetical protein
MEGGGMRLSRRGILAVLTGCAARGTVQFQAKGDTPEYLTVSVEAGHSDNWLVVRAGTREAKVPFSEVIDALQRDPAGWELGHPLNNQCPVCGQMADPFIRPTSPVTTYLQDADGNLLTDSNGNFIAVNERQEPYGPTQNITRCARCNTAFYQDADR